MTPSWWFGILAVIIIILLIISVSYFTARAKAEVTVLHTTDGTMTQVTHHPTRVTAHPIFDTPHAPDTPPEQRESTLEVSSRPLSKGEALVVYGVIPRNLPYWGITGYLYSVADPSTGITRVVHAAVGDSVSSGTVSSVAHGDGVAVVMTSNPYMYDEISERITKQWRADNHRQPLHVHAMYIPLEMSSPNVTGAKYTVSFTTVLRKPDQHVPQFQCTLWTSPNINVSKNAVPAQLRDRSTAPKEHDILSDSAWHTAALNALSSKEYVMLREIPVTLPHQDLYLASRQASGGRPGP